MRSDLLLDGPLTRLNVLIALIDGFECLIRVTSAHFFKSVSVL
jgi:hypothetical protein